MLLTLLLDFSAADARWIGRIVWVLAFVLWLPQLLIGWLVLRQGSGGHRSLTAQLLLLLLPVLLLAATVVGAPGLAVLLYVYAEVQWVLWLLVLLLPTFGAMLTAVVRHTPRPAAEAGPRGGRQGWPGWLTFAGLFVVLAGMGQLCRPTYTAPVESGGYALPSGRAAERAAKAREDSLRFIEKYAERPERTW